LSVIVSVPLSAPLVAGEKVTSIVQELPAARLLEQLLVWAKFPVVPMLVMASAAVPVLLKVTGWDALVVPWF
jgi:hypothetical protein